MSIKELVGHRSTLMMYRDCLKVTPMMSPGNQVAIDNIKLNFRHEFEKQRAFKDEHEHEVFRSGIVRLLSNFLVYEVKTQYLADPEKFANRTQNIYEPEDDEEEETEAAPVHDVSKLYDQSF
jgi:hypothetical protein